MYAMITVDETMDIQCRGITSSETKAKKWYNDYKKEITNNGRDCNVTLNEWVSQDGRDHCIEVTANGRFYELMKVCKRP